MRLFTLIASAFALYLAVCTAPASASEQTDCVARVLHENGISTKQARRIPTDRHLTYAGRDMGALPAGSSVWAACRYYPALAQALAERDEALARESAARTLFVASSIKTESLEKKRDRLAESDAYYRQATGVLGVSAFLFAILAAILAVLCREAGRGLMRAKDELAPLKAKLQQAEAGEQLVKQREASAHAQLQRVLASLPCSEFDYAIDPECLVDPSKGPQTFRVYATGIERMLFENREKRDLMSIHLKGFAEWNLDPETGRFAGDSYYVGRIELRPSGMVFVRDNQSIARQLAKVFKGDKQVTRWAAERGIALRPEEKIRFSDHSHGMSTAA